MKITLPTMRVLRAFLDAPGEHRWGFDLMNETGLSSGSLYPILARLTAEGWVTREKEDIDPAQAGRPARRYYILTGVGATEARQALAEASAAITPRDTGWLPGRLADGSAR